MPLGVAIPLFLAATAASAIQGNQQRQAQKRGVRRQAEAQRLATSRAVSESRRQEMASRKLNQRKPDVNSLLGKEQEAAGAGPGATLLSGPGGVDRDKLTLGKSSLLGA